MLAWRAFFVSAQAFCWGPASEIPTPQREVDKPFLMCIEDVFSISGRGTVGTGRIEKGIVKVGENYLGLEVAEGKDGPIVITLQKNAVGALLPKGTLKNL